VKPYYDVYKQSYSNWLYHGKIRDSELYGEMCIKRREFKRQLKRCRNECEQKRYESLALDHLNGDFASFWQKIKSFDKGTVLLSETIDGISGSNAIREYWADFYEKQF